MAGEFNLGDIVAYVKADVSKFKAGMQEAGDQSKSFADTYKGVATKVAVGLGVVGAGMTLIAKNATDFTVDFVKSSKALGREIGVTTEEASRLVFAVGRMGISADQAASVFGIFSKKINEAANNTDANRIANEQLQVQIDKTKREIAKTTDEIKLHGDKTGDLALKIRGLKTDLDSYNDKLQQTGNGLDQLGIKTADANGVQKGFTTILGEVADKFKAMPDGVTKTALSMELFGRNGKDMIKVLNLGSQGITDLEKTADKLGITLTDKTVGGVAKLIESQKKLKENSDAIKLAIGTLTAPVLASWNEKLAELIGKFQTLNPHTKELVANVLAFGGPVITATAGFIGFSSSFVQLITNIGPAIAAIKEMTVVQWLFNAALWANPITWVVLGIAAFIAILVIAYTHSQTFRDFVTQSFNAVQDVARITFNWIKANWPLLLGILTAGIGTAIVWIVQHWDTVTAVFKGIPNFLKSVLSGVEHIITDPFKTAFNTIKDGVADAKKALTKLNPLQRFSPSLFDLVQTGTAAITDQYQGMFKNINGMAANLSPNLASSIVSSSNMITTNVNGPVSIGSTSDANMFFKRLTRGQELAQLGIPVPPGGLG